MNKLSNRGRASFSERGAESISDHEPSEDAETDQEAFRSTTSRSGAVPRVDSALEAPVFILGATRSGTTVLGLMLGHHPDIAHASELEWVWDGMQDGKEPNLAEYHEWLTTNRSFMFHKLRIDPALGFRALTRDLLRQVRDSHAGVSAREKRELVCQVHRHYEQALITFPRARFIHIVRDGRDVCASWIKFGWLGNGYEGGQRWKQSVEEWDAVKALIPPSQRIELRFEELIAKPEAELQRLCDFLKLAYDPSTLRYHEHSTYQPVDPGQAGKWRTQLSASDLRMFESLAASELTKNGYALSGQPLHALRGLGRLKASVDDKVKHHRARMQKFGVMLWSKDIATRVLGLDEAHKRAQLEMDAVEDRLVRERGGRLR